ncbi:MAG TPA: beta-ketoacyl-ACP synthase III [Mesorhizobium sp.]|jgi:beta-ketodecanoyl-[acyl-carrier-protein] synthase|nr:beta-ketoacyl-ACP synthase III [Mesorhizobium sp.]
MERVIISGIGVEIPPTAISNEELVACFNAWASDENARRAAKNLPALPLSDAAFIEHASGIRQRHVLFPEGVLDPRRMTPKIPERDDDELSVQAEFGCRAARAALGEAGLDGGAIDMVICSTSHPQRLYPAVAIEIQSALEARGAAFDMNLGCASAAAALHLAFSLVRSGAQRRVLVVTPEIITGHLDFRDRQTHFIFGDAAVAVVVEAWNGMSDQSGRFEVLNTAVWTEFSNNIRTNFGYLQRAAQDDTSALRMEGKLIKQQGNRVFKEVSMGVHRVIDEFLQANGLGVEGIRRFWLHQANARMNAMILKLALGQEADQDRAPTVLERVGNTAAAGAVIALHENRHDLQTGDLGVLCAFGAGYSIGAGLLRKL